MAIPTPSSQDLFALSEPGATQPYRFSIRDLADLGTASPFDISIGAVIPEAPIDLRADMGGQLRDFMWCSFASWRVVSRRVTDLMRAKEVVGWSTYDVLLYDRHDQKIHGYDGLSITGPAYPWDREASSLVTLPPIVNHARPSRVYRNITIRDGLWNGSDMFRIAELGTTVVTKRVRDLFREAKVTNVQFTPLCQLELSKHMIDIIDRRHQQK